MRKHDLVVIVPLLTIFLLFTEFASAQCASALAGTSGSGSDVAINIQGSGLSTADVADGIAVWTNGCPGQAGSSFPDFNIGGTGDIVVNISFNSSGPAPGTGTCGSINLHRNSVTGEITGADIVIGAFDQYGISCAPFSGAISHELGHVLGLDDSACAGNIMAAPQWGSGNTRIWGTPGPDDCQVADDQWQTDSETNPDPCAGGGGASASKTAGGPCSGGSGQAITVYYNGFSPIVIDLGHDGFRFTDAESGVVFDLDADGIPDRIAWIAPSPELNDVFLALDRNGDGMINDGTELFGNSTPQTPTARPNGYLALGEFDKIEAGGNGDGWITVGDLVFSDLVVWFDFNLDGVSQRDEMLGLDDVSVTGIDLSYRVNRRQDPNGNLLLYSSTAQVDASFHQVQTTDVFFVTINDNNQTKINE